MSPSSPIEELLHWFALFWQDAERRHARNRSSLKPLHRVRANWELWWWERLSPVQRSEITELVKAMPRAAQQGFVGELAELLRHRWGSGGCKLVMLQVARLPLFESWRAFAPFRLENLPAVNSVILEAPHGGRPEDVKSLVFALVPRESSEPLFAFLNLELGEATAEHSYKSILSLLRGRGLVILLLAAAVFGSKPRASWLRFLRWIGWASLGCVLISILYAPGMVEGVFEPVLIALLSLVFLMGGSSFVSYGREILYGRRLARCLEQNQVCVVASGVRDGMTLEVDGQSLGLALAQGILLALHEDSSVSLQDSWLWRGYFRQLAAVLPYWAITGELGGTGGVGQVGRLNDKLEAVANHSNVTSFAMPFQAADLPPVVSRKQEAAQVARSIPVFGDPFKIRIWRFTHLATFVLGVGGVLRFCAVPFNLFSLMSFIVACLAVPDAWRLFSPPPRPDFIYWKCDRAYYDFSGHYLKLWFKTDYPERFSIQLDGNLFSGHETLPFVKEPLFPGQASVEIQLVGLNGLSPKDRLQWNFYVVRRETFLGNTIREVRVIQAPAWGVLQKSEQDRRIGLSADGGETYPR